MERASRKSRAAGRKERWHDFLHSSFFPAKSPSTIEKKCIAKQVKKIMAGERSGPLEPMPAVMLSMESARESTKASVGERTEGSFLFTCLEKEIVVRSLAGWNLSGSASYNL